MQLNTVNKPIRLICQLNLHRAGNKILKEKHRRTLASHPTVRYHPSVLLWLCQLRISF